MPRRILITGGSGFIGSHLAAAHKAAGDEVHLLVRPGGPARLSLLALPDLEVHRVHLADQQAMTRCLDKVRPEVIYHLASATGRDTSIPPPGAIPLLLRDLTNFLTLLAAAAEARLPPKCLVRAGSLAEYGDAPIPYSESQREAPLTVYTTAMVAGAHYSRMLQPRLPFPVVTARFALTYGPGQDEDFFLPWLIGRCLRGEPSDIRNPEARRNMIFVEDLVDGLRKMADAGLPGGTILNLSADGAVSVRAIASEVVEACGAAPSLLRFPDAIARDYRVQSLDGSPELAHTLLGWQAITPLPQGIRRCVQGQVRREARA